MTGGTRGKMNKGTNVISLKKKRNAKKYAKFNRLYKYLLIIVCIPILISLYFVLDKFLIEYGLI